MSLACPRAPGHLCGNNMWRMRTRTSWLACAAGAIMLGKTVTTQFACFDPPETRNPWNPQRTPGGSSSGSAVAVASGMCLAALGTQTGGSIIRPAAYCGVVGFKPTWGAWSMHGIIPVSFQLDHVGPLATGVEDIWHIWRTVSGGYQAGPAVLLPLDGGPILHMPTGSFLDQCDRAVWSVFDASVRRLAAQGATVVRDELPSCLEDAPRMHRRIMVVELAEYHSQAFAQDPSKYAAGITELIREGSRTPATDYAVARQHREMCMAAVDQIQAERPRSLDHAGHHFGGSRSRDDGQSRIELALELLWATSRDLSERRHARGAPRRAAIGGASPWRVVTARGRPMV